MNRYLNFFRKYYGSLVGAIIGVMLVSLFYGLSKFQNGSLSSDMLYILDLATMLVVPTMLVAMTFAPFLMMFAFFSSAGMYILAIVHIIFTIILYSVIGFLIHYIVLKLVKSQGKVDKKEKM